MSVQESDSELHEITLTVNGVRQTRRIEARLLLSDFLRHTLDLTGTHVGCEHGSCGACTVLMDGEAVRSCICFAVQADGHEITTVEGLAPGTASAAAGPDQSSAAQPPLHPIQEAFREKHALQCGYCTPGFLLTLVPFLRDNPTPDEHQVRDLLSGNICRCTGYNNIIDAALLAAERMRSNNHSPAAGAQ